MDWITEPARKIPIVAEVELLVAGRCLSAEEEILSQLRLIPVCSASGQAAGTAAALALREKKSPEELEAGQIQNTLQNQGMDLGLSITF